MTNKRARVLDTVHSARLLKGLIKQGEFLVAERIHSMIGAVGVGTPFLCMGSNTDRRIRGIIGEMVGMTDAIYHLNSPRLPDLCDNFDDLWERRVEVENRLNSVYVNLGVRLEEAAKKMRKHIGSKSQWSD